MKKIYYSIAAWLLVNILYNAFSPDPQFVEVLQNGEKVQALILSDTNKVLDSIYFAVNNVLLISFAVYTLGWEDAKGFIVLAKSFIVFMSLKTIYEIFQIFGFMHDNISSNLYMTVSALLFILTTKLIMYDERG